MLKTIDDLKIGSVIRFGSYSADKNDQSPPPIEWYKADQDNRLLSRYCIDYLVFDTIEHHTELYWLTPNADYALSNIHQFLNSEETEWWAPTHPNDACPNRGMSWASYAGHAGFLSLFFLCLSISSLSIMRSAMASEVPSTSMDFGLLARIA